MPLRLKAQRQGERDESPAPEAYRHEWDLPHIEQHESFQEVIKKLSLHVSNNSFFTDVVDLPSSFEQLRTTSAGDGLMALVEHLGHTCTNRTIVSALLSLRWHYVTDKEHRGLSEARGNACEIVAWRFLTSLSEREAVDYCLYEIPGKEALDATALMSSNTFLYRNEESTEYSPLLGNSALNGSGRPSVGSNRRAQLMQAIPKLTMVADVDSDFENNPGDLNGDNAAYNPLTGQADPNSTFKNLNALEIAAIANAKRFLSQYIVQKIITGLWNGDIIFWDSVSATATRMPRYYNPGTTDPYSRLRVPKYLKAWEAFFFAIFLALYYSVVVHRDLTSIPMVEVAFYVWLVSFLWDEFQEWADAGIFYMTDIWNLFDMSMITLGVTFAVLRVIGITMSSLAVTNTAFDILSLEALLVVPRIFSFLSLSPYWGTLIPCLKEMGKDFVKFMILVVIVYLGFLTTFSLISRDTFTFGNMTWEITKIFYGNTNIAFRIMNDIDANFGPPLMLLFITLSSILLTGTLTGMLSNSFGRVMAQSREEYLYVYSVYVLEASTSSRLTHFLPPFNIIALVFFRPWRFIFPKDDRFRHSRVVALKITHAPVVLLIRLYESLCRKIAGTSILAKEAGQSFSGGRTRSNSQAPPPPRHRDTPAGRSRTGRDRGSGELPASYRRRFNSLSAQRRPLGYSEYLRPGYRPSPATGTDWGAAEEGDHSDHSPSNSELMRRIEKLTAMVATLQEHQNQQAQHRTSALRNEEETLVSVS
ncbi:Calcium channel-like protein [Emericellopsis cladophorae]|uniref:Calcium channel-like protein n=1 Tax=Emericellopsis cladophorae TaxID=2686198 RepID=A0A9P9Y4I6_9HYPO|nr:Calcium channel-like protein [Emericellopsis cladophorae]KAI6783326.1 Calcium channel-like protein [Emericellopsis cladophorae]